MNKLKLTLIGLALVFVSTFANAVSVSGNAAIQTDYIWRGMTQNDGQNSVNVGLDVDFENGFYVGTWGAAVDVGESTLELDYYGGYSGSIGDIGYDIGFIEVTYPGVSASDFSETYLGLDVMGVGLFYAAGDEFGDYAEISYGFDAGPGSIGLSYGDYEDSGTNYVIGYDIPVGDFTLSLAYTDYESDSGTADEDAFVVTLGM